MTATYPVAASADEALASPWGLAAREREAAALAGGAVDFVTESVGPAFETKDALAAVYGAALSAPFAAVRPVSAAPLAAPHAPVNLDGRRWPDRRAAAPPQWRLSVSFWRIRAAETAPAGVARALRRSAEAGGLSAQELRALARQPLRAMKPQQPLDVGLFEMRPPEAPDRLIPDE